MYFLSLLMGCIVVIFRYVLHRSQIRQFVKFAKRIPGNKLHTWIGLGPLVKIKDGVKYAYNYGNIYGSDCILWSGIIPVFLTFEPETVKSILASKHLLNKPQFLYGIITKSLGRGLITHNEPVWSQRRKIVNPAFSNKNLISFLPIFNKEVDGIIQRINNENKQNKLNLLELFRLLTLKSASQTVLKRNLNLTEYSNDAEGFVKRLHRHFDFLADICLSFKLRLKIIQTFYKKTLFKDAEVGRKEMIGYVAESINIVLSPENGEQSYIPSINGVVDYAIRAVQLNLLEMSQMEGELIQLFLGAFETTSITLFMVITMLAMHPKYQDLLYEELTSILPDDENNEVLIENLELMVNMDMVLNETMRLFPPVPQIFRKLHNDSFILPNGNILPKGQIILIDIYHLHRNKTIWGPDADQFNPYNFLPINASSRHPYSFIPFAKGLRNCIGWRYGLLSMKVMLAKLIKSYTFSTDFKYENLLIENHISLNLTNQPVIVVHKRNRNK